MRRLTRARDYWAKQPYHIRHYSAHKSVWDAVGDPVEGTVAYKLTALGTRP